MASTRGRLRVQPDQEKVYLAGQLLVEKEQQEKRLEMVFAEARAIICRIYNIDGALESISGQTDHRNNPQGREPVAKAIDLIPLHANPNVSFDMDRAIFLIRKTYGDKFLNFELPKVTTNGKSSSLPESGLHKAGGSAPNQDQQIFQKSLSTGSNAKTFIGTRTYRQLPQPSDDQSEGKSTETSSLSNNVSRILGSARSTIGGKSLNSHDPKSLATDGLDSSSDEEPLLNRRKRQGAAYATGGEKGSVNSSNNAQIVTGSGHNAGNVISASKNPLTSNGEAPGQEQTTTAQGSVVETQSNGLPKLPGVKYPNPESKAKKLFGKGKVYDLDLEIDPWAVPGCCPCGRDDRWDNMIACSGNHSEDVWYHYFCANVSNKFEGEWFCWECCESIHRSSLNKTGGHWKPRHRLCLESAIRSHGSTYRGFWPDVHKTMKDTFYIHRTDGSLKNQWSRYDRANTGYDERKNKTSQLQTSVLKSAKRNINASTKQGNRRQFAQIVIEEEEEWKAALGPHRKGKAKRKRSASATSTTRKSRKTDNGRDSSYDEDSSDSSSDSSSDDFPTASAKPPSDPSPDPPAEPTSDHSPDDQAKPSSDSDDKDFVAGPETANINGTRKSPEHASDDQEGEEQEATNEVDDEDSGNVAPATTPDGYDTLIEPRTFIFDTNEPDFAANAGPDSTILMADDTPFNNIMNQNVFLGAQDIDNSGLITNAQQSHNHQDQPIDTMAAEIDAFDQLYAGDDDPGAFEEAFLDFVDY